MAMAGATWRVAFGRLQNVQPSSVAGWRPMFIVWQRNYISCWNSWRLDFGLWVWLIAWWRISQNFLENVYKFLLLWAVHNAICYSVDNCFFSNNVINLLWTRYASPSPNLELAKPWTELKSSWDRTIVWELEQMINHSIAVSLYHRTSSMYPTS